MSEEFGPRPLALQFFSLIFGLMSRHGMRAAFKEQRSTMGLYCVIDGIPHPLTGYLDAEYTGAEVLRGRRAEYEYYKATGELDNFEVEQIHSIEAGVPVSVLKL